MPTKTVTDASFEAVALSPLGENLGKLIAGESLTS